MAFCSSCGSKLEDGALFCQACGAKIEEAPNPETENTVPNQIPVQETASQPIPQYSNQVPQYQNQVPQYQNQTPQYQQEPKATNVMAILSMIAGILSLVICWLFLPGAIVAFIFAILGIVFFCLSKKKGKSGMATAGLITSIIGIVSSIVMTIIFVVLTIAAGAIVEGADDWVNELQDDIEEYSQSVEENQNELEGKTFGVNDVITTDDLKITVLSGSIDFTDYGEYIEPAKGKKYAYVELEVENISDEEQNPSSFAEAYVDDTEVEQVYYVNKEKYDKTIGTTLAAGKKTQGYLIFEVPEDATELEVVYSIDFWDDTAATIIIK